MKSRTLSVIENGILLRSKDGDDAPFLMNRAGHLRDVRVDDLFSGNQRQVIMAGLNVELNQAAEFFSRFGRFGGNIQLLKQLLADDERMRSWVELALASVASTGYTVSIDRSLPLVQMIEAGKYSNHEAALESITEERFPVNRLGELKYEKELFLIAPSHSGISTTEWKTELETNEWELEETPELLALGAKFPDLQRDHHIIAFGSSRIDPDDGLFSPVLWGNVGKREAGTGWYDPDYQWNRHHRRALVSRKRC